MDKTYDIAVLVGSLRKESFSRKVAIAAMEVAPPALKCRVVELRDLTIYNEDLESPTAPPAWTKFRQEIVGAQAILFVTPEYNRSIPGGLKNAIDVGSRPYGKSVWNGKPCGVISVSPSKLGGVSANHAVRQSLVFLDAPVMQMPEAYIGEVKSLLDDQGRLAKDDTKVFLSNFMSSFERWVSKLAAAGA